MCSGRVTFWSYLWGSGVTENPHQLQWLFFFLSGFQLIFISRKSELAGISDKRPLAQRHKHQLLDKTLFQTPKQEAVAPWLLAGPAGGQWDGLSEMSGQAWRLPGMAIADRACGSPCLPSPAWLLDTQGSVWAQRSRCWVPLCTAVDTCLLVTPV